ncbi:hypothetical protein [Serratia sp. 2723]|uniref:hypothetical protein n=1 Tax=unclassified Serratia (in: enterobacteria) TaxID=2647522 RepID=UPI003D1D5386
MDRSLLVFYCIWGIALLYLGVKLVKDKNKWHGIGLILSVIISLVFASSFSSLSTGMWFLLVIVSTFVILFLSAFIITILKHHSMARYVHGRVNQLKNSSPADMVEYLVEDNKKQWYVLYLPLDGSIEIGVNLFGKAPVVGEKIYIKTLTGRHMHFIPKYILKEIDLKSNIICILQNFYYIDHQTKKLVDDYILRIKTGHKEPWLLNKEINEK